MLTTAAAADVEDSECDDAWLAATGACVSPLAVLGAGTTVGTSAYVGRYAAVGPDVALGGLTHIGERATLVGRVSGAGLRPVGERSHIGRRVTIGGDHDIGADNTLSRAVVAGVRFTSQANVSVGYATELGDDVVVDAGAVLGTLVSVGDNTHIEAGTILARQVRIADSTTSGVIGGIIGPDVTIGGDAVIADTVRIRKQAVLGEGVTIGAGARVGRGVQVGDGASIGQRVRIGAGARITASSVVPDDTVIPRDAVYDNPATGEFIGGTLLSQSDMQSINGWVGTPGQDWELCYKWTVDPQTSSAFHLACDHYQGSVTVFRANGKTFGGYTPMTWSGTLVKSEPTQSSFLFSLDNDFRHDLISTSNHIFAHPNYWPFFGGGGDASFDVFEKGECNLGHTYECRVGTYQSSECAMDFCGVSSGTQFIPEDFEVYGRM